MRPEEKERDTLRLLLKHHVEEAKADFRVALADVWRLRSGWVPSRVQRDIAWWMQHGPVRRIIRGARGITKTWICCAYEDWRLDQDNETKILLCSQSMGHSEESLLLSRAWLDLVPYWRYLTVRSDPRQRDSQRKFDVGPCKWDRTASIAAQGIKGQLAGGRSNLVISDDVEMEENTYTRDQRLRLRRRVREFERMIVPGGDILYLGTPFHEESLYTFLVEESGYISRSWPILYPTDEEREDDLAPMLATDMDEGRAQPGDPVWPERFNRDEVRMRRLGTGKTAFAMQFMLRTNLAEEERYPLRCEDLIVFPIDRDRAPRNIAWGKHDGSGSTCLEDLPCVGFSDDAFYRPIMIANEWDPYAGCKAALDPAGGGDDELALAIVGQLNGFLYGKHILGLQGGSSAENLETVVLALKNHRVRDLYIETNFGGDMLMQLLEPVLRRHAVSPTDNDLQFPNGWACSIFGIHSAGQKELRIIHTLEPVMDQHRLVVCPDVAEDITLMRQLTRVTRDRGCLDHADRLDALAMAVGQWKETLRLDALELQKMREQEDRDDVVKDFLEGLELADSRLEPNWLAPYRRN